MIPKPTTLYTFVEGLQLEIDCDKALPVSLKEIGQRREDERFIYRRLTRKERRELIYCTLAFGQSPILYRLLRLLRLSMTRRLYPQQGAPKKPRSKTGSDRRPSPRKRKCTPCKPPHSGHSMEFN